MKRLISIIFVVLILTITGGSGYAFDWKTLNTELVDQTENDSQTIVTLKDKQDLIFKVIYQDETMLAKLGPKIIKYKNEFFSWRRIHAKDITFMVFANFLNVVIIPQAINHNQNNIAPALPAGITMAYDLEKDVMRYDFRVMKDDEFVRITGNYSREDELVNKIGAAYDNPAGSLLLINPDPLQPADIGQNTEKMVQALIYLNNEDWNGRHKVISLDNIRKVVELRQQNPTMKEAQLWKLVKKEKIPISKREMELILILCFNEFN